ncbi:RdgB/HAM1 family non-canonical purine NTP pyrophosphatase [Haploplasma axanthum]|uniref:dITP/XTP pyrophosphatase n=1 Tax=Haploplasma axanthum TaxID=29552 RepID=A0A449BCJ0_HAPAX|nr:RdgB/HAM1 family non-canonical purine NTP pyrophosphatase [Haploplasma axanthum]VEU80152.1 Non-canonical purine NTP pyrophosphatase [Haploplasma axanthum]
MEVIVASHNKNKIKEFKSILGNEYNIKSLEDLNDFEDIEETGNTFSENALIKALSIAKKYNKVAIADDSGLEVYSLDNRPGVYSARYSGKGDHENNLKILSELKNNKNRNGRFISVIALCYPNGEYQLFEGIWEGRISEEIKGENGFGYDVIFIPEGFEKTVAELEPDVKDKYSHRSKALKLLKDYFAKKQ